MLKLVVVIGVLFLVYLVLFRKNRSSNIDENTKKKNEEITDTMIECPTCKVYTSKEDSILSNGKYYCSKECLK